MTFCSLFELFRVFLSNYLFFRVSEKSVVNYFNLFFYDIESVRDRDEMTLNSPWVGVQQQEGQHAHDDRSLQLASKWCTLICFRYGWNGNVAEMTFSTPRSSTMIQFDILTMHLSCFWDTAWYSKFYFYIPPYLTSPSSGQLSHECFIIESCCPTVAVMWCCNWIVLIAVEPMMMTMYTIAGFDLMT